MPTVQEVRLPQQKKVTITLVAAIPKRRQLRTTSIIKRQAARSTDSRTVTQNYTTSRLQMLISITMLLLIKQIVAAHHLPFSTMLIVWPIRLTSSNKLTNSSQFSQKIRRTVPMPMKSAKLLVGPTQAIQPVQAPVVYLLRSLNTTPPHHSRTLLKRQL